MLNSGRIIQLFAGRTFVQYSIAFCRRLEVASDVMSGRFVGLTVSGERMKSRDPRLNRSQEIPSGAVVGGIQQFFTITSDRK